MSEPLHLLVVAGDPSGDRHAASLVTDLKARIPELRFSALGGPSLEKVVDRFLFSLVALGGFGFWEPLLKLPALWRARKKALDVLQNDRPAILILVDYYGFNIHVARAAKQRRIPVLYYISPQVWASRPHRIQQLKQVVRRMIVLFPFEKALYEKAGVPVTGVMHPLLKQLPPPAPAPTSLTIGLLPGSRSSVIQRHLPILQETVKRLRDLHPDARFVMIRPTDANPALFRTFEINCPWVEMHRDKRYDIRRQLTLALSVSGTSALELTLLGIPMILYYKLSSLTYALAKLFIRIPYIGIPNILAARLVAPEYIQDQCTPESLSQAASSLITQATNREQMRQSLLALREQLQENGATAADVVTSELSFQKAPA